MSMSSFATAGLPWPLPTMSNACSSGTPAFIIVASWRVNSVMSFSVTLPPLPRFCFLILMTLMPCRRSSRVDLRLRRRRASRRATVLPALSLPSQREVEFLDVRPLLPQRLQLP